MSSNIRLVTNVICIESEGVRLSQSEFASRLGYFELIEYRRVNPILFSTNVLTARQQAECDGPQGRKQSGLTRLWARRPDIVPFESTHDRNPFESDQDQVDDPPAEPEASFDLPPDWTSITAEPEKASEPSPDNVAEQDAVIQADLDTDLLVVAPPGTGKTHVLVERIAYLVKTRAAENPLAEVLVLSFTRSAVAELRKRLIKKVTEGESEDMLYTKIRTFDSLATQLLKCDLDSQNLAIGYGKRIAQFNDCLKNDLLPNAAEEISDIKFLLVDEVQDLNGSRAEMVLELARRVRENGGCSVFLGDPAQAIYDFSDENVPAGLTSVQFLEKLIDGSYSNQAPRRVEFSNYRRFETPEILDFVRSARSAMGESGLTPDGAQLDELLRSLGKRLPLEGLAKLATMPARKALLTRNNLEAYWLWKYCKSAGIPARLWRGASGNYWPGWIGRLTLGFQSDVMSIDMAEKRWKSFISEHTLTSFAEAMDFLRDQGALDAVAKQIRIPELNRLIANSAPVQHACESSEHIVISTIHRSKGLEFENVFLYSPTEGALGNGEEVRVVYVAATRAKRHLQLLDRNQSVVRRGLKNGKRLSTSSFHIFKYPEYPHIGLLIDGADVMSPESILLQVDPLESQKFLWEKCAGNPRNLVIDTSSLRCEGMEIGELESSTQNDLTRIRSLRGSQCNKLNGLVAEDLATVALEPDNTVTKQYLGAACLGMVPVVSGVVSI